MSRTTQRRTTSGFNLLNRGLFVPVFADSDACFDRTTLGIKAPGFWTTYFYVGPNGQVNDATPHGRRAQWAHLCNNRATHAVSDRRSDQRRTIVPDGKPHTVTVGRFVYQHAFRLENTDPKTKEAVGVAKVELIRTERWSRVGAALNESSPDRPDNREGALLVYSAGVRHRRTLGR